MIHFSDGFFEDPDNCQCFYDCAGNVAYHECCGAGELVVTIIMMRVLLTS